MGSSVKRVYRSPLREAQAASTSRAIVNAAGRLFVERGYVATSIDAIAAAAEVSRATVFAAGTSKATLLKTAYDVALVGDDEPVPLPERPRSRRIRAERDAYRYLELYAGLIAEIGDRLAPIYEAVRGAASADPQVRGVFEKIQAERRIGGDHVVADLVDRGPLRDGLEPQIAADLVWILNDPGLCHLLVHRRGWPLGDYARWLAETMCAQLLGPRDGSAADDEPE